MNSINVSLARLANIFNLEVIPAEINGKEACALADIEDTDKIFYGPVWGDGSGLVDQHMVLDALNERLDDLDNCHIEQLNLWDRDLIDHNSPGWWFDLYVMSEILTSVNDLTGENIDTISEAAEDQIILALREIIEEIEKELA